MLTGSGSRRFTSSITRAASVTRHADCTLSKILIEDRPRKHSNAMIRRPLVSPLRSLACALFAALSLVPASASAGQTLPYLFESDASGPPNKLLWQSEPGVRYELWQSDDLASWSRVTGYPAAAAGLAMEHAFTPGPQRFFKIVPCAQFSLPSNSK
jgi:hypothetical protein